MKINTLSVGQIVYVAEKIDSNILSNSRSKKRLKTIAVYPIYVSEISEDGRYVMASKNGNPVRRFREDQVAKWKKEEPITVKCGFGIYRLATKEEKEEIKNKQ